MRDHARRGAALAGVAALALMLASTGTGTQPARAGGAQPSPAGGLTAGLPGGDLLPARLVAPTTAAPPAPPGPTATITASSTPAPTATLKVTPTPGASKPATSTPPPSAPTPAPSAPTPVVTPAPSTLPPAPPASTPAALHVAGNLLVDSSGQTVTLHGVDMSGTEYVCAQNWSEDPFGGQPEDSAATFAAMRSWNVNTVRIPLNEDCWLGIDGVEIGGAAYQSAIVQLVDDLQSAGFYVILDLHWSAPGRQIALSQNPAPDEDHSPAFWSSVASTFGGDGSVLFDLYNEPYFYWTTSGENEWQCLWQGCTLTQYVTGGSPYTVTADWVSAGFDQLTSDIRGAGASNVIMAGCVDWANDCSDWSSSFAQWGSGDADTVVSWHSYPGQTCGTETCWNSAIAPLATQRPVIVGETGNSSAGPVTYLPTFLPWASAHRLSFLAWTWNAWGAANDDLVTSMSAGTPTAGEGAYYRQYLLGLG